VKTLLGQKKMKVFLEPIESLLARVSSFILSQTSLPSLFSISSPTQLLALSRARIPPRFQGLLVLDLDHTLIHSFEYGVHRPGKPADFIIQGECDRMYVYKRPGVDEFLRFALDTFEGVGIYSSGTNVYVESCVRRLLGKDYERLAFVFGRNECKLLPASHGDLVKALEVYEKSVENGTETLTVTKALTCAHPLSVWLPELGHVWMLKPLQRIWELPLAKQRSWNHTNTVAVDDSHLHNICNYTNTVMVPSFLATSNAETCDTTLSSLTVYLRQLSVCGRDVRDINLSIWNHNPFELQLYS